MHTQLRLIQVFSSEPAARSPLLPSQVYRFGMTQSCIVRRQTYPSIWIRNHQQNRMLNSLPQLLALLFVNIHLQFVQLEMSITILIASLRCPDANVCRGSLVRQSCRPCRDWIRIFSYTECVAANTDTCQVTSSKPHTSHAFLVHWCTLLSFTHLGSDLPEAAEAQLDFAQTAQS